MSTIPAYAIARDGVLIVDTVRASEADSRCAVLKILKQPGVTWKELAKQGYAVVRVQVAVGAERPCKAAVKVATGMLTPPAPPAPPPPRSRADEQPIRLADRVLRSNP